MAKICKACDTENRDEANFCRSCGSPLPKKKEAVIIDKNKMKKVREFWIKVGLIAFGVFVILFFVLKNIEYTHKMETYKSYITKFNKEDDQAFGTITKDKFLFQSLTWGMTIDDIKKIYPYIIESRDPDFYSSWTINQTDYRVPVPHADFISIGVYNNYVYAFKLEFGPMAEFQSQMLKVPNRDEIMYGRFRGLEKIFTELYGPPTFDKDEVKKMELKQAIKTLKAGRLPNGMPSNIYKYWELGQTKAELVFFSMKNKLHLTVRFLYLPVWNKIGR
ncbi:MAG: zinc ribbon domain-containing protein [Candidatus Goldbacteria bacterium]|nr:zinc ribbon domain-containing protein [Candidatus Goldiibacteriota bacterium]